MKSRPEVHPGRGSHVKSIYKPRLHMLPISNITLNESQDPGVLKGVVKGRKMTGDRAFLNPLEPDVSQMFGEPCLESSSSLTHV